MQMKASAWAVFKTAKTRAACAVLNPWARTRSSAIAFQCPGGVKVPGPSAQKSAIARCSGVNVLETSYTSRRSASKRASPGRGGGGGRRATGSPMFQGLTLPQPGSSGGRKPGGVGTQNSGPTGIGDGKDRSAPSLLALATSSSPDARPRAKLRPTLEREAACRERLARSSKWPALSGKKYVITVEAAPSAAATVDAPGLTPATPRSIATLRAASTREACGGSTRWAAISPSAISIHGLTARSGDAGPECADGVQSAATATSVSSICARFITTPSSKLRCRD